MPPTEAGSIFNPNIKYNYPITERRLVSME
jgi:hypothetical protein